MTDPNNIQAAIQRLIDGQATPEDQLALRQALAVGEMRITGHDQITVGNISDSAVIAIGAGAQAHVNITVPPEQLKKLLSQGQSVSERRELRAWQEEHLKLAVQAFALEQQELRQQLRNPPKPETPYKGLNYFDPLDQAIFHGREAVAEQFVRRMFLPRNRLTVLHAPSGAGKTSLLRAGLLPRLLAAGCYVLWATPPYRTVYQEIAALTPGGPEPSLEGYSDPPLNDTLAWLGRGLGVTGAAPLAVFLDQFERCFDPGAAQSLEAVESDLAACARATDALLPLRLVISVRSDFAGLLDRFRKRLPSVLDQRLMLDPLTRPQALEAIAAPLQGWEVAWEAGAAEAVLDYLAKGEIEPPHLQLICDQLYRRTVENGRAAITCADVQAHDLALLHRQYLQNQMAGLGEREELGWALLRQLVSAQAIARPRPLAEVRQVLGAAVDELVGELVDCRILRVAARSTGRQVEIAHETLAQEILQRQSPQERRRKAAAEMIGRGLDDWLGHESQPLMGLERLRILDDYQDVLELPLLLDGGRSEAQGLEFLLRSALAAGYAVPFWFERAAAGGVGVQAIAEEGLKAEKWQARVAAVKALAALAQENQKFNFCQKLNFLLADDYPQVRIAAIRALEALQPSGEWRAHLKYECYVPAGAFSMGDGEEESEYNNTKTTPHEVSLAAFYIARYPVTNAEYKRFMADREQTYDIPAGKEQHPVANVSWHMARQYCAWAGMRLPSEAEWEKAASWQPGPDLTGFSESAAGRVVGADGRSDRASVRGNLSGLLGRKRVYPWGDAFDKNKCNTEESGINNTTRVGQYSPDGDSPYGCADMAGNVWEWTSSLYKPYPYRAQDGREDAASPDKRVLRGGSYQNDQKSARCAFRGWYVPDNFSGDFGFRVVASLACSDF